MRKNHYDNKSLNIKLAIIYFSILISLQAIGILLILKRKSIVLGFIAGLGLAFILPIVLGVILVSIVKYKEKGEN